MPSSTRRIRKYLVWALTGLIAIIPVLFVLVIKVINVPPRLLAPYVERRATGHNPVIEYLGRQIGQTLIMLDRGSIPISGTLPKWAGAQLESGSTVATSSARSRVVFVRSAEEARHAIANAEPGDEITFLPGTYRFQGRAIEVLRAGTRAANITVRAEKPQTVILNFAMLEGFHVLAPYWIFENLTIRGTCKHHWECEHGFHVVGKGTNFIARNNTIIDFNAQFKINGENGYYPDDGLIENNTLQNTSIRRTSNPVTPIDLVAASNWTIRHNLISDFFKGEGDQTSYGAFAKGAGGNNRFEQNVVVCEFRLHGPGRRVGLSLGGGGSNKNACRDRRCIVEQENSILEANLVTSCSDEGIYLNSAASSQIRHNTLIDTAGISVRFPTSSADVEGNLVDGSIRSRDGALLRETDNYTTSLFLLYLGMHPVNNFFSDTHELDLIWRTDPKRRKMEAQAPLDLCGIPRPSRPTYGAFEDFGNCRMRVPHTNSALE